MPYGSISLLQAAAIGSQVNGRVVHDLGAGDLCNTSQLLDLGATRIVAIDKEPKPKRQYSSKIEYLQTYFADYRGDIDVAFLCWPPNYCVGLVPLLKRANTIIYLGKNTDGTASGPVEMFRYLMKRDIIEYIPDRRNTLILYREVGPLGYRAPRGEEAAALDSDSGSPHWTFEQAETLASRFELNLQP